MSNHKAEKLGAEQNKYTDAENAIVSRVFAFCRSVGLDTDAKIAKEVGLKSRQVVQGWGKKSLPTLSHLLALVEKYPGAAGLLTEKPLAVEPGACGNQSQRISPTHDLAAPVAGCPNHGVCAMTSRLLRLLSESIGSYAADHDESRRDAFLKTIEAAAHILQAPPAAEESSSG